MIIRDAKSEDKDAIVSVLKASLGEADLPLSNKIWNYKHENNPFGKSQVLLAVENGEVVGVRAFMKWNWQLGEESFIAYRAVDTATHPNHQGKGIFKKLTLEAVNIVNKNSGNFIFNTPNDQSRPGYLKMGWKTVGKVSVGIKPALNSFYKLSNESEEYKIEKVNEQSTYKLCNIWNEKLKTTKKLFTPKSPNYLYWRYENNPLQKYEVFSNDNIYITGYIKKRGRIRELRIAECIYKNISYRDEILKTVRKWSSKFGAQFITFSPFLAKNILWGIHGGYGPVLTLRELNIEHTQIQNISHIKNWASSLGDLELF
jgi:GNAT superfamily N-acetyltransferase